MSTLDINSVPPRAIEKLRELCAEHAELSRRLVDPAVLSDHRQVRSLSVRRAAIAPTVEAFGAHQKAEREAAELARVIEADQDADLVQLAREELPTLREQSESALRGALAGLVTSDDRSIGSVILEIRAGTGGDEAALWARDLLEMYQKYAAKRRWQLEVIEFSAESGTGGIRSATATVKGDGVWSELAFEAGVHSVKRVPATEAQGRIHTSTATVAVLPEPEAVDVKIDWANDVEENVTTSQGPGGQNVNKVATAVQLFHRPSGIMIRMQESKSQQQNRERARRLLLAKLHDIEQRRKHAERSAARKSQIGTGDRSEKIRTYRWKEGIVADERLPGEYQLRDLLSGDFEELFKDLLEAETMRRLAEL